MLEPILKELTPKLEKAIEFLHDELASIHTGRASVSLVDTITVDAYGSKQLLKQVASITIPEPRQILIQPWDRSLVGQIESAIRASDLGFGPVNTGDAIRINIPELTEERRKEFVKVAKERAEEAKISVRNARSEAWNAVKKEKNDGEIGEDEMYRGEERIQTEVDKTNKKIEEILAQKEKELMEI
jgi:ribosome recycling factor